MRSLDEIKLFLLDMDGTVYLGEKLFPSAVPFLNKVREIGAEYQFLTNNSSKDKGAYLEKLAGMGIACDGRRLMTSGDAAIDFLVNERAAKSVFLVGTTALADAFASAGIELRDYNDADIAVVGFDTQLNYYKLRGLYAMVSEGKEYICTHPDLVCPTENGFIPDIGATIAYIRALTGRGPDLVIGKPERYMIDAAAKRFSVDVSETAMVGDRLYTDIAMADRAGATSVLVLSGETKAEDLAKSAVQPDYVFEDLSGITEALK